jgi:hypothetical protein
MLLAGLYELWKPPYNIFPHFTTLNVALDGVLRQIILKGEEGEMLIFLRLSAVNYNLFSYSREITTIVKLLNIHIFQRRPYR